jgi:hypothetical protein
VQVQRVKELSLAPPESEALLGLVVGGNRRRSRSAKRVLDAMLGSWFGAKFGLPVTTSRRMPASLVVSVGVCVGGDHSFDHHLRCYRERHVVDRFARRGRSLGYRHELLARRVAQAQLLELRWQAHSAAEGDEVVDFLRWPILEANCVSVPKFTFSPCM